MHHGASVHAYARRLCIVLRSLGHLAMLRRWHAVSGSAPHDEMLCRHALEPVLREQPYINMAWSAERRMRAIETHYQLLEGPLACLYFPLDGRLCVADLDDIYPGLRLVLDRPVWFRHEGEMALNLFCIEERLYSLLFTLGEAQGGCVAYIGALQGRAGERTIEMYRSVAHALHAMRPRDLLVASFRLLCKEVGVERVYAVSDVHSVRRSAYFNGAADVHVSYDAVWRECQGGPATEGFFELSTALKQRTAAEIPTRKRAQYRRRYAMLESVRQRIAASLLGSKPLPEMDERAPWAA